MPTINGIAYPDEPTDILSDRTVGPLFKRFLISEFNDDIVMFFQGRFDPKKIYKVFLSGSGRKRLNLPGPIYDQAETLANAGNWKMKPWATLLSEVWESLNFLISQNYKQRFYSSDPFKECHALQLADKEAKRIAREVGTKDIKAMKNAIRALALSATRDANKIVAESQKHAEAWDKAQEPRKPDSVITRIRKRLRLK